VATSIGDELCTAAATLIGASAATSIDAELLTVTAT
jgi:hypothetical protein